MMRLSLEREANFPNLHPGTYKITSVEDVTYNCIAHAAGADDAWWWPVSGIDGVVWPDGIPQEVSLDCFAVAYELRGYQKCADAKLEAGFEKVALYVDHKGEPTHAARQLSSGAWTSKLGEWEDIEHEALSALEDPTGRGLAYGKVVLIMRRQWQ